MGGISSVDKKDACSNPPYCEELVHASKYYEVALKDWETVFARKKQSLFR